jgi:hypothetical protein
MSDMLQEFAKFLIAGMDMRGDVRAATWPEWSKEEEKVHRRWILETNRGQQRCSDPMVTSWNSAQHHWFILPKLREFVQ